MRSAAEIRFRFRQELSNAWWLLRQPQCPCSQPAPLALLPDSAWVAEQLRGTPYAAGVERIAEQILRHDFALLGLRIQTGPDIRWRRDYTRGVETEKHYFRILPYLDAARAGDHKQIWELNRHQHLVLLAQAWRLTGRPEFYREIIRQLENWWDENPFQRGINWASALEVGFRALSWIWIYHLVGEQMEEPFRHRFCTALYQHGLHLERNLSLYFSRNTHLLGEALALHAMGVLFPTFPRARRWEQLGARIVSEEIDNQVREDGAHFEQSSYYHVYALDMFLFHAILAPPAAGYLRKLRYMAEYLDALLGPSRAIPLIGDDDGGRLFHPYGIRNQFGRATMATAALVLDQEWAFDTEDLYEQAAWWLGDRAFRDPASRAGRPAESRLFAASGMAILAVGDLRVYADAGPLGFNRAGHGHSDTLSIVVRRGQEDILIDPGTYTYVAEPEWRDRFRGSAGHNTVRIDGRDQAVPLVPFGWSGKPDVRILEWISDANEDVLDAICSYAGFTHRRRIRLEKPGRLFILDEVAGPPGEHSIEQFWHAGGPVVPLLPNAFRIGRQAALLLEPGAQGELSEGGEYGWRSPALGCKLPAPVIRVARRASLPLCIGTALVFDPPAAAMQLGRAGNRLFLR